LLTGDPKAALVHFRKAADLDPDYVLNFTLLPQGVWTYVGRAYYNQKEFSEARKAFERARSRHPQDNLAKLYLGLVLARDGNRQQGTKELEAGLTGLRDWLNYLEYYHPDGRFWDSSKRIRSEIQGSLAIISAKDIDWPKLIASGAWIGRKMEEEIDFARMDKIDELYRNNGDDGGGMN
jgi:tetratricopeptide (TPR) repeat protein